MSHSNPVAAHKTPADRVGPHSFVFYRFRSQKEPSRISFDGTGISVWDLKKEIIMENKMGKGIDFDFAIYNADTEEGAWFAHCSARIDGGFGAKARAVERSGVHRRRPKSSGVFPRCCE